MTVLVGQGSSGTAFSATTADGTSFWIGDTGSGFHMTSDPAYIYDGTSPFPCKSKVILEDCTLKDVAFEWKLDLLFHSTTDAYITLEKNISCLD